MAYNTPNDEFMRKIQEDRDNGWKNPYAFKDEDILRREYKDHDEATLARPAFARDIEKILNIPAYNRYNGKTQVFSFFENDDICRRGLHVQLVSRIARSIGDVLGLNTLLIEAIALGHDLGHTPFGHAGEYILSDIYHERTDHKYKFSHNVNSVRVMDKLYPRNISLQTLDGALCHNGEFVKKELSVGDTKTFEQLEAVVDKCMVEPKTIKEHSPSTLEGCVVRVSDMIAYIGKDRDDAFRRGVIPNYGMFTSRTIGVTNGQIIHNVTHDIIEHSYGKDKIAMSEEVYLDLKDAKDQNYDYIYSQEGTVGNEHAVIVEAMFREVYDQLLSDYLAGDESSPIFRHHIDNLVDHACSIKRETYMQEDPDRIVVDYISSMTDSYFIALHHYLFPNSTHKVFVRDYFAGLREAAK